MARAAYRTLSPLLLLLVALPPLPAQEPNQAELQRLRSEKLQKPVFARNGWSSDFDAACRRARQEQKVLFVYFTRSHRPCPPCDVVENGLLAEDRFAAFAGQVVPVVHVTSLCTDEPHPGLHAAMGLQSFPAFVFVDADGKLLARPPQDTVESFTATLAKVTELRAERERAERGSSEARTRVFVLEADLGRLDAEALQAGLAAHPGLAPADADRIRTRLTDLRLDALQGEARRLGEAELLARIGALARAGGRPSEAKAPQFWAQALACAAAEHDAKLAEQAYGQLVARYGRDQNKARQLEAWRALRDRAAR